MNRAIIFLISKYGGTGCFVAGLEFSAGATAEVVGKPEPRFFEAAMEALKAEDPRVADLKKEGGELSFFCLIFFCGCRQSCLSLLLLLLLLLTWLLRHRQATLYIQH